MDVLNEEEFDFYREWIEKKWVVEEKKNQLNVEDYELKILILASVLAENDLSFTGTIKTMCEWLGINGVKTTNKDKLRNAIANLVSKGYIVAKEVEKKITIIITKKGLKNDRTIRLRKSWIQTMKQFKDEKISISWIQLLKVFIYIYDLPSGRIITNKKIADDLCISENTVLKAIKVFGIIKEFGNFAVYVGKKVIRKDLGGGKYVTIGTTHNLRVSAFEIN